MRGRWVRAIAAALGLQWRVAPGRSLVTFASSALYGLSAPLAGWWLKRLIDELALGPAASPQVAEWLAVGCASIGALSLGVLQLSGYVGQQVHWAVTAHVERELFDKVSSLVGVRELETPRLLSHVRQAEQAAQSAPQQLSELLYSVVQVVVTVSASVAVIASVSWQLVVALALAGGAGVTARLLFSRKQAAISAALNDTYRWRDYHRELLVDVRAAKEIRLYGLRRLFVERLLATIRRAASQELSLVLGNAVTQFLLAVAVAVLTAGGAWLVTRGALEGRLRAGDVTLFLAALTAVQAASTSLLRELGVAAHSVVLFESYLVVVGLPSEAAGGRPVPPLRRALELRDVWFRYDPSGPWVLRGLNLTLRAGESVGLVGVNGAGKSTLLKLLCRLWEPERGQLTWDGVDMRELDPAQLRARLSATFQDFMSYEASAADNIGFGDVERLGDLEAIRAAARLAQVDATVSALPGGYQTLLSKVLSAEDDPEALPGVGLSGGQWQRLALARSLMRPHADLLILDEPSAGLDPDAEYQVHRMLQRHGLGKTRLLVSHRLSALRRADRIVVLSDGVITEDGSHESLLRADGAYARLFRLQSEGYQPAMQESA